MSTPSRAFTFVDRITEIRARSAVRGYYDIPADLPSFPAALVGEAIGQLAAWEAMAGIGFEGRPVAGLADRITILRPVKPGERLELAADIESLDAEAVSYSGTADVDGERVFELAHAVGPMMPIEEFQDPNEVYRRYEELQEKGPGPDAERFGGLPPMDLERVDGERGSWAHSRIHVPSEAAIFADHFPRRAVFPGTLLMLANLELAKALADEADDGGRPWRPSVVRDVKLRAFTTPGDSLGIEARVTEDEVSGDAGDEVHVTVETKNKKRTVGRARVLLTREEGS